MDPQANLREQRAIARDLHAILNPPGFLSETKQDEVIALADRLAELVLALAEWQAKGGFSPYKAVEHERMPDGTYGGAREVPQSSK